MLDERASGGIYRACIRSLEGTDHWMQGVYREVIEPERLVLTFAWEDEDNQPKHETLVTVTFTEQGNQTLMTFLLYFHEFGTRFTDNFGRSKPINSRSTS